MSEKKAVSAAEEPISVILAGIRLSDSFYCKSYCHAPWGFVNPPGSGSIFHFVIEGSTTIETIDGEKIEINKGDLALLKNGDSHILRSHSDAHIFTFDSVDHEQTGPNSWKSILGSDGELTVIVCGGVTFDPSWHPLFEILPPVLCLRQREQEGTRWSEALVSLIGSEVTGDLPGSEAIITRLSEVLVIGAMRSWMLHNVDATSGWLKALRDEKLGRAIARIHKAPGEVWTVGKLAAEVSLSRTVFAQRFSTMVGIPPMQYINHLRMNLAGDMLRGGRYALVKIAKEVGYGSEISFSRAFSRFWGQPPGSFRRHPEKGKPFGITSQSKLSARFPSEVLNTARSN